MIPVLLKRAFLALSALFLLNCRTTQFAYVQPTHAYLAPTESAPASLPLTDAKATNESGDRPSILAQPTVLVGDPVDKAVLLPRHQNPDAQSAKRRSWLHQSLLYVPSGEHYTAPRFIATVNTKRTVPKGTIYALAGGALPYGLFLVDKLPVWAWWMSLALPVASLFLATGSLAKIRRNREQFRGRGWAVAAMLLATSYLGMVLYAVAAIAASGVLWE